MKGLTLISILFVLTITAGCKKTVECIDGGNIAGDIRGYFVWPKCYIANNWSANGFVIRSGNDLDTAANCVSEAFNVDFNKYSVLGRHIEVNCHIFTAKRLEINHSVKQYIYTIWVKQCGKCDAIAMDDNLVLVDKVPANYQVRFELEYE